MNVDHNTAIRYREYTFPIRLVFKRQDVFGGIDKYRTFLHQFMVYVGSPRIIYSGYGNPYKCSFYTDAPVIDTNDEKGLVAIQCSGKAVRVFTK